MRVATLALVRRSGLDHVQVPTVGRLGFRRVHDAFPFPRLDGFARRALKAPDALVGRMIPGGPVVTLDAALRDKDNLGLPFVRGDTSQRVLDGPVSPHPDFVPKDVTDGTALQVLLVVRPKDPASVASELDGSFFRDAFRANQRDHRRHRFPQKAQAGFQEVVGVAVNLSEDERGAGSKARENHAGRFDKPSLGHLDGSLHRNL